MNRHKYTIGIALLAFVMIAAGIAITLAMGDDRRRDWATDGAAIRVPAATAPIREILWQPAIRLPLASLPGAGAVAENEGSGTSASTDEYEPRYSADGTMLVFVRGRPGANADLFTSRWTPAGWTDPVAITTVNTTADELGPELSRDGESLYFYSDRAGGLGGYDLWVSRASDPAPAGGDASAVAAPGPAIALAWGPPINLGARINSRWNEYGPGLTPEGDRLFFSSNRPRPGEPVTTGESWTATIREHRTRHDYDLYSAATGTAREAGAGNAQPLIALNTPSDEGAPAVSPAGDFLYFASDRTGGVALGGFDLYRTRLARGAGRDPARPENLGPAVNSSANDLDPALSSDGFRLCFSSDREVPLGGPTVPVGSSPAAAAPPQPPFITPDATTTGRYALWSSVSREIYRESEITAGPSRLAEAWSRFWPWLLLALLALIPLALLYYLIRSEKWRRRFGRLSLIAQCVLISLLIHALLASFFTVWKVGSGIIDLIQDGDGDGGTRVILASGSPGGDAAGQLRGGVATDPLAIPEIAISSAAPDSHPLETPRADFAMPALAIPIAAMAAAPIQPAAERSAPVETSTASNIDRPAPSPTTLPATAARESSSPEAMLSPSGTELASGADAGPVVPDSTARVALDVPRLASGVRDATPSLNTPAPPSRPDHSARTAASTPDVHPSATAPGGDASLPAASTSRERAAEPTTNSATLLPAPSTGSAAAPAAPSTQSPSRVDVALPSVGAASDKSAPAGGLISIDANPATRRDTAASATPGVAGPAAADAAPAGSNAGVPAASASRERAAEPTANGAALLPAPTTGAAASPGAPAARGPSRVDVSLPSIGAASDKSTPAGGPISVDANPATRRDTASASPGVSPASADAAPAGSTSGVPAVADRRPGKGEPAEATLPGAGQGIPDAPIAAAGPAIDAAPRAGGGMTIVDPGRLADKSGTGAVSTPVPLPIPGALARNTEPSTDRPTGADTTPGPVPIGSLPGLSAGDDVRLPAGPITPVDDFAQRAPESRTELVERMGGSAETERAVGLALEWFTKHQERDGRWSARHFGDADNCGGGAEFDADAAMTGMALLCYLGAGHTHQQEGPYRDTVDLALRWLLSRQDRSGDLRRGETMYGQTVATVALCEALAMTRDPALAEPARRAVAFVLARATGGDSVPERDKSVLGWLVFTVETARRAGIEVPRATFDAAQQWLDSVTVQGSPGLYGYSRGQKASAAMTAEAMFVQQLLGHNREEAMMGRSAEFIARSPPKWDQNAPTHSWYYATLALFQHQGDDWKRWNEAMVRELLAAQRTQGPCAGSWDPQDQWSRMGGRVYQTAVCTLSLEVYYRYKAK